VGAKYFGAAVRRREDPRFLRGEARFVDDVTLPGLLHAAFVRSPHAHATITRIRTEAAKTMPVSLNELQSGYEIRWGVMTAGAVIHTLPAMLMVIFAQRYIITGMTMGAVKG